MLARSLSTSARTTPAFNLTPKQAEANRLLGGPARNVMLRGGSRSGKTFLLVRAVIQRGLNAPGSRHAIFRFRFNHAKTSVWSDTMPKVLKLCFPGLSARFDKTDFFLELPNGSQVWIGGLDDKERVENRTHAGSRADPAARHALMACQSCQKAREAAAQSMRSLGRGDVAIAASQAMKAVSAVAEKAESLRVRAFTRRR